MNNLDALLILNAVSGLGPIRVRAMIEHFGSPEKVLAASRDELLAIAHIPQHAILNMIHFSKDKFLTNEYALLRSNNVSIVTIEDEGYPSHLREIASALAAFDIGQSVVISDRACVALEAMEGTDAILRRAHTLTGGKPQLLVKSSRRRKHLLFDVPVLGPATMDVMHETNTAAATMDAGRTLLLDREELIEKADRYGISLLGSITA